jgi:hypothetical protein
MTKNPISISVMDTISLILQFSHAPLSLRLGLQSSQVTSPNRFIVFFERFRRADLTGEAFGNSASQEN